MYIEDSFMPFFLSEAQDVNERFIQIARLNCGGCLLTKLYCTSFLFVHCVRTMRGVPLRGELKFLMLFYPFFFLCVFPLSFWSLLFAAFPISSNVLQAPWLFLRWNQCHHLTPISYINDKGECLISCSPRFMSSLRTWAEKWRNFSWFAGLSLFFVCLRKVTFVNIFCSSKLF